MRNRWLLNLALLVVVAALAGVAWYRANRAAVDDRPLLTDLKPAAVARVAIEPKQKPAVVLERRDNAWRLVQPFAARANAFAVDTLLSITAAPSEAQLSVEPNALAQYGLAPPALILRLGDDTIEFGAMHPLKPLHYVRYRDKVHLIASRYFAHANTRATDLIDTRLIEDGRRPTAFQFPGFGLTLTDGSWQRRPEDKNISGDRIHDFIEEWRNARALSVERYAGRAPLERIRITFESDDKTSTTLTLGVLARTPELVLYRQDEGLEYHFPEESGKRLLTLSAGDR